MSFKLYSTEFYVQIHKISQSDLPSFEKYLIDIKKLGFSGVFLRVFQNRGDRFHNIKPIKNKIGVYFENNQNIPIINPLIDNLKSPLKTILWMSTRWMDWENGVKYGKYLLLQDNNNYERIMRIFKELSEKNSDGILLQDDLVIKKAEEKKYKIKNKNLLIERYIKDIKKIIKDKELIVNVYYEVPLSDNIGISWYGQSIKGILNAGADSIAIMLYHRQIKRELKFNSQKLHHYIKNIIEKLKPYAEKVYVKLQIRDFKTGEFINQKELMKIIKLIPKNFKGIVFTPITTNKSDFNYIKTLIEKIR